MTTTHHEARCQIRAALASDDTRTERWLSRLPWRIRECVRIVYLDGLTHRDAALRLNCSPKTVYRDLWAARERWLGYMSCDDMIS
jgi:DNA-directed RNA polymerase specialized sigma24 family protein